PIDAKFAPIGRGERHAHEPGLVNRDARVHALLGVSERVVSPADHHPGHAAPRSRRLARWMPLASSRALVSESDIPLPMGSVTSHWPSVNRATPISGASSLHALMCPPPWCATTSRINPNSLISLSFPHRDMVGPWLSAI